MCGKDGDWLVVSSRRQPCVELWRGGVSANPFAEPWSQPAPWPLVRKSVRGEDERVGFVRASLHTMPL